MNEEDFEGSLVLEKLALIGKVQEFFDAIDSDDFEQVGYLLRLAKLDGRTISEVLRQIRNVG